MIQLLTKEENLKQNQTLILNQILTKKPCQYLDFASAYIPSVFKGFIKGEPIRYLRNTNDSSEPEKSLSEFNINLI